MLMGAGKAADSSAPAWTPASTTLAAWYSIGDLSTLFKDTAGTLPVTADGDVVMRINDKSGNGLHLKAQIGPGYVYRANGGKSYVETSGTSEYFASDSAAALFNGSGEHSVVAVGLLASGVGGQFWQNLQNPTATLALSAGALVTRAFDSGGATTSDFGDSPATNTPFVAMGVVSTSTIEAFLDNASSGSTSSPASLATTNGRVWAPGYSLTGRLYEIWCSKQVYSSGDRASAQTYGAGRY